MMRLFYINLVQSLRHIRRHAGQVSLSVFGLVCGLVCFTLSASDLWYRTHYDDFRRDYRQLYRLQAYTPGNGLYEYSYAIDTRKIVDLRSRLPQGTSVALTDDYPLYHRLSGTGEEDSWTEQALKGEYVDASFPELMDVKVLDGDIRGLWKAPDCIAVTDSLALQLFGSIRAVGHRLYLENSYNPESSQRGYDVVAVIRKESHTAVPFDFLLPYRQPELSDLYAVKSCVYVRTDHPDELLRQLALSDSLYNKGRTGLPERLGLQPLRIAPLVEADGNLWKSAFYPLSFLLLSVLLLFSAVFNHTALFTSMCLGQLWEYRLRLCLGGGFADNARRLLLEVLLLALIVWMLGAVVLELFAPVYGSPLPPAQLYGWYALLALGLLVLLLFFLLYPLGCLRRLYRSSLVSGGRRNGMQASLIVVQMAVSVLLLFLVINGYRQFRFITRDGLGFSVDNILVVKASGFYPAKSMDQMLSAETARALRQASPAIEDACFLLNRIFQNGMWIAQPASVMREGASDDDVNLAFLPAEAISFFKMDVRGWEGEPMDYVPCPGEALVSPSFVSQYGLTQDDCLLTNVCGTSYRVSGILNCRTVSFGQAMLPTVFLPEQANVGSGARDLYVKYLPGRRDEALASVFRMAERMGVAAGEMKVQDYADVVLDFYKKEQHYLVLFGVLAFVGMCITLFGVLALIAYELQRNRRSIAVHRIFGAGFRHLCRHYAFICLTTVGMGAAIALPVGYFLMDRWLQCYDEQIIVGVWSAVASVLLLLSFTVCVVWLCLRKTLWEQPADVIKNE